MLRAALYFFLLQSFSASLNINLINDYLAEHHLKYCILLQCSGNRISSVRSFDQPIYFNEYWIDGAKLSDDQFRRLFYYVNHPIGVAIDLNCDASYFLGRMSNWTMFHQRYYWLMFADNLERAKYLLEGQNINVDAEITLAIAQNG